LPRDNKSSSKGHGWAMGTHDALCMHNCGTPLTVDGRPLFLTPMMVDARDAIHLGLSSICTIGCVFVTSLVV